MKHTIWFSLTTKKKSFDNRPTFNEYIYIYNKRKATKN